MQFKENISKSDSRSFDTNVVGVSYYNRQSVIAQLYQGAEVWLKREPENPHDKNAIGVYNVKWEQIGYIGRDYAANLASRFDAIGAPITAIVTAITSGEHSLTDYKPYHYSDKIQSMLGVRIRFTVPDFSRRQIVNLNCDFRDYDCVKDEWNGDSMNELNNSVICRLAIVKELLYLGDLDDASKQLQKITHESFSQNALEKISFLIKEDKKSEALFLIDSYTNHLKQTSSNKDLLMKYLIKSPSLFLSLQINCKIDAILLTELDDAIIRLCTSNNKNIKWTEELIAIYANNLDWSALSINTNIPWSESILDKFSNYWDWEALSLNKSIPWNFAILDKYRDQWGYFGWIKLSFNESLPWSELLIDKFIDKLCFYSLSGNKKVPWSLELLKKHSSQLNWEELSGNTALPWSLELIYQFEEKWDWRALSYNANLPWSEALINKYIENWNWYWLSRNPKIPWTDDLIYKFNDRLDLSGLCMNYGLSWSESYCLNFIEKRIIQRRDIEDDNYLQDTRIKNLFSILSCNESILWTVMLISSFRNYWNWDFLSKNKLTWTTELIDYFIDEWNWSMLSSNQSLPWSIDLLNRYIDRWDWRLIGLNEKIPWSVFLLEKFEQKLDYNYLFANEDFFNKLDPECIQHILLSFKNESERYLSNKTIEINDNGISIICNRLDLDVAEKMLSRIKSSNIVKDKLNSIARTACPSHSDPDRLAIDICNASISYIKEKWHLSRYNLEFYVGDFFKTKEKLELLSFGKPYYLCPSDESYDEFQSRMQDEECKAMSSYYQEYEDSEDDYDDY